MTTLNDLFDLTVIVLFVVTATLWATIIQGIL
jgi:hypothetical protein